MKYKLLKQYPDCMWEAGAIIDAKDIRDEIIDYPEFWEKEVNDLGFKAGDWAVLIKGSGGILDSHRFIGKLYRFVEKRKGAAYSLFPEYTPAINIGEKPFYRMVNPSSRYFRPAAEEEVRFHLQVIADKKKFEAGTKFITIDYENGETATITDAKCLYNLENDYLYLLTDRSIPYRRIYWKGHWAKRVKTKKDVKQKMEKKMQEHSFKTVQELPGFNKGSVGTTSAWKEKFNVDPAKYPDWFREIVEPKVGIWVVTPQGIVGQIIEIRQEDAWVILQGLPGKFNPEYLKLATDSNVETVLRAKAIFKGLIPGAVYYYPKFPKLGLRKVQSGIFNYFTAADDLAEVETGNIVYSKGDWVKLTKDEETVDVTITLKMPKKAAGELIEKATKAADHQIK